MNDAAYDELLARLTKGDTPPPGMALVSATATSADATNPNDVRVLVDGDTLDVPVLSLIGAVNLGARVKVLFWPPHGAYIIGRSGYATAGPWRSVNDEGLFTSGWADSGGGLQPAEFRLEGNWVHVRGIVTRTSGVATTIFTLPAGYRPAAQENFAVDATANAHSGIAVMASGNVDWGQGAAADATYVSLSGVAFSVYDYV